MEQLTLELERLQAAAPGLAPEAEADRGVFWINIPKEALRSVVTLLRDDPELDYKMLSDLFGVDYPTRENRFDILYNLYSLSRNRRVFLRLRVVDMQSLTPRTPMPSYHRIAGLADVAPAWRGRPLLTAGEVEDIVAYLSTLR